MYRIVKDGTVLGLTEQPNFVEPLDNGAWGLCDEPRARAIAWEGKVYGLTGKSDTDDLELVTLAYVDGGALTAVAEATQAERQLQTESAIAELSILIATMGGTSDV